MEPIDRRRFLAASAAATFGQATLESAPAPRPSRSEPPIPPRFEEPPLPEGVYARLGSARFRILPNNSVLLLTSDGRYLVTGDRSRYVVWNVATGCRLAEHALPRLGGGQQGITLGAVDGPYLFGTGAGKRNLLVCKIDLFSGRVVKIVRAGPLSMRPVVFDPTGRHVLSVSGERPDERVACRDCETGALLWAADCESPGEEPVAFSGDGSRVAVIALGVPYIRDARTGVPICRLADASRVVLSQTGRLAAAWMRGASELRVHDAATGEPRWRQDFGNMVYDARFLSDDSGLLVTTEEHVVLIDPKSGGPLRRFSHLRAVRFAISRDSGTAVVENVSGGLVFLDLRKGERLAPSTDPCGRVDGLHYLSRRHLVGTSDWFHTVWDIPNRLAHTVTPLQQAAEYGARLSAAVAPDGLRHAAVVRAGVWIFDPANPTPRRLIPPPGLTKVEWVDGATLIGFTEAGAVVFGTAGGAVRPLGKPSPGVIVDLALSGDGQVVFVQSREAILDRDELRFHLMRFDPASWKGRVLVSDSGNNWISCVSADGRRLVASQRLENACDLIVRDGDTGAVVRRLPDAYPESPSGISPDGRTIAMNRRRQLGEGEDAPWEYDTRLVEVGTAGTRRCFPFTTPPLAMAFSPDGRTLATAHDDAPVFLWDIYGERTNPLPKPHAAALREAWVDLASADAERGFRAVCLLVQHPNEAVPMLAANLKPAAAVDPKQIRQAIEELADRNYRTREAAERELAGIVNEVRPQLQAAFDGGTHGPEAGQRLERLLHRTMEAATPWTIRAVRAHEVLERIGTPAAKAVVEASAKGAPAAAQTQDAAATLGRWEFNTRSS